MLTSTNVFGHRNSRPLDQRATFCFPSHPVLVSRKNGVHHSVVEFAAGTFLQILLDGLPDFDRPFSL